MNAALMARTIILCQKANYSSGGGGSRCTVNDRSFGGDENGSGGQVQRHFVQSESIACESNNR